MRITRRSRLIRVPSSYSAIHYTIIKESIGHFAEQDEYEPPANVDALEEVLRRTGRPVTFYRYSGSGHWFFAHKRMRF